MRYRALPRRTVAIAVVAADLSLGAGRQGRVGQPPAGPPPTAKARAPIDLTGYWVSLITEDWRWRMVTPPKGDYQSVPITAEAQRLADLWKPAKDEAAGEECRSYGAAAIMRVPGRVRITWPDDDTLKVETDAGMQTRLLRFRSSSAQEKPTWQGHSVAEWEIPGGVGGRGGAAPGAGEGARGGAGQAPPKFGHLKVVTTNMRPGYLRKNGVPYSENAVLTEYWDLYKEKNGEQWLVITSLVDDPKYLQQQYVTSPNFKKESDEAKWDPTPCSARW